MRLPKFSCPFRSCAFHTEERAAFLQHLVWEGSQHQQAIAAIVAASGTSNSWVDTFAYLHGAMTAIEQKQWPWLGLSVTRRSLTTLCDRYNDRNTKCLVCFCCAQQRTTFAGLPSLTGERQSSIDLNSPAWFVNAEQAHPGTLLTHCGYGAWRYKFASQGDPFTPDDDDPIWKRQWTMKVATHSGTEYELFGCTEDVCCKRHGKFCDPLCPDCLVPVCSDCMVGIQSFTTFGKLPMVLANDHYYG